MTIATRAIEKADPKDIDAPPEIVVENYDPETGQRICEGWKRRRSTADGSFTLPGPEYLASGLKPEFSTSRPGRYLLPEELSGRSW